MCDFIHYVCTSKSKKSRDFSESLSHLSWDFYRYRLFSAYELPELPHLHPHLFRHTRAMHLLEAGVPLALIGEWLGHTDLETTRIYATATISMKREASMKVTSAHPTIFPNNNQFMYLDDEEKMRKLYGLK